MFFPFLEHVSLGCYHGWGVFLVTRVVVKLGNMEK